MASESARLAQAVQTLYAGPPAEFVSTRTALVKQARTEKDREAATAIGALRKPTASADAVNRVVRADHPVVDDLRGLGTRLRLAQSGLDAAGLSALRGPRDEVIAAFLEAVEEVSGRHTPAVLSEVRDTVIAALADAEGEAVVCSGALTRALAYSGFGEVDVSDAVARTSTGVLLTRLEGGGSGTAGTAAEETPDAAGPDPALVALAMDAVAAAEKEVRRSTAEVAQATRLLTQAQRRADVAQAAYEQASRDLAGLRGEADRVEQE